MGKLKDKAKELEELDLDKIEASEWRGVPETQLTVYYLAQILKTLKRIEAKS